ncbi:1,4-alpha-glucan branching enzyme [Granulicella rosea]|uniref:1,4-alpha-glucan branching enzyme n=1 Tax=Granulicella rosea TaxID=474952 RepID=A0A239E9B2_9BACT|nr:alpha-amylase family glycosyl hydrolase [Granulicella rosea]SNS41069.1 1,4-alpha-glucan branching enzyme [Granulicella rosea]
MNAPSQKQDGMGSLLYPDGTARFRVWAPSASGIDVVLWNAVGASKSYPLANEIGTPNWSADGIPAIVNTCYQYVITTAPGQDNDASKPHWRTDARALQVENSTEAGRGYVIDPTLFTTNRTTFTTPPFEDFVIYQLHVGSFTGRNDNLNRTVPTSTFVELKNRLPYIRSLGFNAIELLPISNFQADVAGGAGEGYGPSDLFASENLYATSPEKAVAELIELIDAAHSIGLAVILDLIFNHAALNNNRYWQYDGNCSGDNGHPGGIYHVHGHHTDWGEGFATWQREVRNFLLDNARLYLRDYRVDGLRFDAAQAIDPAAVSEILWSLRIEYPSKYLIAEYNPSDPGTTVASPQDAYGYLGFCATWNMDSPWRMYDILNGINVIDYLCKRIGDFSDSNPWHLVQYLTGSHDQIYLDDKNPNGLYIAQRFGGRLNGYARAKSRLAWALNATLAGTPMLFMGTEGHIDGYWNPWVEGQIDHRLDWLRIGDDLGAPMQRMVADVNNLRWNHAALRSPAGQITHTDDTNNVVAFKRWNNAGDVLLIVVHAGDGQWSDTSYEVGLDGDGGTWQEIFNSQAPVYGGVNAVGNPGYRLGANDGRLSVSLASWSVHIFVKL